MVKKTKFIEVKNGAQIEVIDAPASELEHLSSVVYLIVHRKTKMVYVGITEQTLKGRWYGGYDPVAQFIGRALQKYGEDAFDRYVVAKTCKTRKSLCKLEHKLIALCGGHKSDWTYNLTPGGDVVSDMAKPIIGVNLITGKELEFKSASDAAKHLKLHLSNICNVANGESKSTKDKNKILWWFRWQHDTTSEPPRHFGKGFKAWFRRLAIEAFNLTTGEWRDFLGCLEVQEAIGVHRTDVWAIIRGKRKSSADKDGNPWWFRERGDTAKPPTEWGMSSGSKSRVKPIIVIPFADRRKRLHFDSAKAAIAAFGISNIIVEVALGHKKSFSANGEHYWATYDTKNIDQMPKEGEYGMAASANRKQKPVIATHVVTGKKTSFPGLSEAGRKFLVNSVRVFRAIKYDRLIGNYRFAYA